MKIKKQKKLFGNGKKVIVVIETRPGLPLTKVTCLMTVQEVEQARLERPDLIFTLGKDLPKEEEVKPQPTKSLDDNPSLGISIMGMTPPPDFEDQAEEILRSLE